MKRTGYVVTNCKPKYFKYCFLSLGLSLKLLAVTKHPPIFLIVLCPGPARESGQREREREHTDKPCLEPAVV